MTTMNRQEFLAAIKGKPTPFTTPSGAVVNLRPMTLPERLAIFAWHAESKDAADYGQKLREQYFAIGVCNADGDRLFQADEVAAIGMPDVDFQAIADEVPRRAGIGVAKVVVKEEDPGKDSPATES
jgi:hypothetical protein